MEDNNDISQELFEIIERYLSGNVSLQELKDIRQLLELDDDFKTKVEDVKTILDGLETNTLKEQLDKLNSDTNNTLKETTNNSPKFINLKTITLAIALIIALGSIFFFSTPKNEKLFAEYFKPAPGLPIKISNYKTSDFYNAMEKYQDGNYSMAIKKWQDLIYKNPDNDTLNYFIGVAHLANKNIDSAIPFLERTINTKKQFYLINDAYFYLGIAYLNEGNSVLAKKYLKQSNATSSKELILQLKD
ncbi:hypothetical protein GCM10022291_28930 [Postechiella marina]|uniref:Tetratricopeptide repeat protein n=1 Tax=Postechiella marina TaxID=943941 RepID=A0ABP8CEY8_9FLAO